MNIINVNSVSVNPYVINTSDKNNVGFVILFLKTTPTFLKNFTWIRFKPNNSIDPQGVVPLFHCSLCRASSARFAIKKPRLRQSAA